MDKYNYITRKGYIREIKKPNLFIVGHPKCGTTALHNFLSQHPDIFISRNKEPEYFCKDFHLISDMFHGFKKHYPYRTDFDYLQLFSEVRDEYIIGESTPFYLYSKVAAREIYNFNPEAKIIIILRQKEDFLRSLHKEFLYTTQENIEDFDKALEAEVKRKSGNYKIWQYCSTPPYLYYSEWTKYEEQVSRFREYFDEKNIMIIQYETFKKDNLRTLKNIFKFLNVDRDFIPSIKKYNKSTKKLNFKFILLFLKLPIIWRITHSIIEPKKYSYYKHLFYKYLNKNRKN